MQQSITIIIHKWVVQIRSVMGAHVTMRHQTTVGGRAASDKTFRGQV